MGFNGLSSDCSVPVESSVESLYGQDLKNEENEKELDKEVSKEENQTESIVYVSAADPVYYDTGEMVSISCSGLSVGCGIAFFASIARFGIEYVKKTFSFFAGAGKEE